MSIVIWHNPRCSKSRQTLALIEERGHQPEVVRYLDNPPTPQDIASVLGLLGIAPRALIRKGEAVYKDMGLSDPAIGDEALIAAMADNPILIERPVVIANGKARLGRPPEQVLDIL